MRVEVDMPNANHALVPGTVRERGVQAAAPGLGRGARGGADVSTATARRWRGWTRTAKSNFVDVTIARDNGNLVELGPGVKPGDRLVLNISSQIAPGQSGCRQRARGAPPKPLTSRR